MALSRFWAGILICSIGFIFAQLLGGRLYTLGTLVNGKQGEPVVVAEWSPADFEQRDSALAAALLSGGAGGIQRGDTLYQALNNGAIQACVGKVQADGIFATCKNTLVDLWLPLIGYLTFFCGLLNLLSDSQAMPRLARFLTPLFTKIFPELPPGHPAYGFMTMNFAANFLGLDNAATPFGLMAMESMQEVNPDKERASNSQIMFLCLHAAGLTLIPTSIIGYRAALNAANPADIMLPTIITSFIGTMVALFLVGFKQRLKIFHPLVLGFVALISGAIGFLLLYISRLAGVAKFHFTGNLSNGALLLVILAVVLYSLAHEQRFRQAQTTVFDSFIHGAKDGFTTGLRILPYMIAMLVALSIFRNSGLMEIVMGGLTPLLKACRVDEQIIQAIPVALMRPFSSGGSRGIMLDAMRVLGADSLAGRLSCVFQGAAETTFYVVALYFGSVKVKNTRYTLGFMLLADLACVVSGIFVCLLYY